MHACFILDICGGQRPPIMVACMRTKHPSKVISHGEHWASIMLSLQMLMVQCPGPAAAAVLVQPTQLQLPAACLPLPAHTPL
jgi:hypothetical protein